MVISAVISSKHSGKNKPIWDRETEFYLGSLLPCVGAMAVALLVSSLVGLPKPEQVAVVIETCYQNIGIATAVALSTFDDEERAAMAAGIPVFYGILEGALFATHMPCCLPLCHRHTLAHCDECLHALWPPPPSRVYRRRLSRRRSCADCA